MDGVQFLFHLLHKTVKKLVQNPRFSRANAAQIRWDPNKYSQNVWRDQMHSHILGGKASAIANCGQSQPCAQIPHSRSIITNGRNQQRNCVIEPIIHRVRPVSPLFSVCPGNGNNKPSDGNFFLFKQSSYEFQLCQYSKQCNSNIYQHFSLITRDSRCWYSRPPRPA